MQDSINTHDASEEVTKFYSLLFHIYSSGSHGKITMWWILLMFYHIYLDKSSNRKWISMHSGKLLSNLFGLKLREFNGDGKKNDRCMPRVNCSTIPVLPIHFILEKMYPALRSITWLLRWGKRLNLSVYFAICLSSRHIVYHNLITIRSYMLIFTPSEKSNNDLPPITNCQKYDDALRWNIDSACIGKSCFFVL